MSCRHARRRASRTELKADVVILLDRITALTAGLSILHPNLPAEIAEMRMRLAPPPGIKAPIVHTGYTRGRR